MGKFPYLSYKGVLLAIDLYDKSRVKKEGIPHERDAGVTREVASFAAAMIAMEFTDLDRCPGMPPSKFGRLPESVGPRGHGQSAKREESGEVQNSDERGGGGTVGVRIARHGAG
jgi:hypothetical protein